MFLAGRSLERSCGVTRGRQRMNHIEELVYEAATNSELFDTLPKIVADAFGARSCSILWNQNASNIPVFGHSKYFSNDQLDNYFHNFSQHDLWITSASDQKRVNRAWLSSDAIEDDVYASSVFYNEWIRPMGDDTFYALGTSLETMDGNGVIGLHRGFGQGNFSASLKQKLDALSSHIRRMLAFRSKYLVQIDAAASWQQGFLNTTIPTFVVDHSLRIRIRNELAERTLRAGRVITEQMGKLCLNSASRDAGLLDKILEASRSDSPKAGNHCAFDEQGFIWIFDILPMVSGPLAGCALVAIKSPITRHAIDSISPRLQQLFRLTVAEGQIAVAIASGSSPEQISYDRGSTIETVRSQIKSIMQKTNLHRQAEIVGLVLSLRS